MGLQGEVCQVGDTTAKSIKDLACKTEGCYLYGNTEPSAIAELRATAVPVYRFRRTALLVKHVLQKKVCDWAWWMECVCVCLSEFVWPEMLILSFWMWLDGVSARAWLQSKSMIKSGIHVLSQSYCLKLYFKSSSKQKARLLLLRRTVASSHTSSEMLQLVM